MSRLLKTIHKFLIKPQKTSYYVQNPYIKQPLYSRNGLVGTHFVHTSADVAALKSPLESNMLRIIYKEIDYQLQYAPPQKPDSKYDTFTVEDHPGEQWVTLKGKSSDNENINIEATMFDGFVDSPQVGGEGWGVNPRLHLSLLIDVWKGEGTERLEFVCSAWPDRLEIQKVFILRCDALPTQPYMGPNIRYPECILLKRYHVNDYTTVIYRLHYVRFLAER
ncbi:hypothetical protein Leryth_024816 [Lithospermum erythrorhizon]|nr:hypothetical protein Leryth_024816 [Lithospermum erythrorhizon]